MNDRDDFAATKLTVLLDMAHRVRHAESTVEVEFMAVNGSHALAPYRQAALWFEDRHVCALSGVVQIEANAPYAQWLHHLCTNLREAGPVTGADVPAALAEEWAEWLPAYALWLPIPEDVAAPGRARGGLLLARDFPWLEQEIALLAEWVDVLAHDLRVRAPRAPAWSLRELRRRIAQERRDGLPWWRRRAVQAALAVLVILCFPVRLTVLAPGELVPAAPATIRAPLDGVIERFHVAPNQAVKQGQPLFDFDEAQLGSRAAVAAQALATAEAEYRQALQQALNDGKSKGQLATIQGKIEERRAETDYLQGQAARARVVAPRDGIALFDDPSEWVGKPVATGERVMRIAAPDDVEVEAWLAIGDGMPLAPGSPVTLYLSSGPLDAVDARVRYMAYEAVQRPDGNYAYRVRATLVSRGGQHVGQKGTAKLAGGWAPMGYWMLRRPLAAIRQTLGV